MASKTNEERTPKIYRKAKGQIVVEGKVNLTDLEGNPIKHGNRFTSVGVQSPKTCLFAMAHTKFRTPFFQIHYR